MATKKPRKMPEGVKRTLAAKRKPKTTTAKRARKVAEKVLKDSQTETVTVRISNVIDSEAVAKALADPEGMARFERLVIDSIERNRGCDAPTFKDCKARFDNLANFGGLPHIPSKEELAAQADNDAVSRLANDMRHRLFEKREAGYGGWNDPTQCDARKLAERYLNKLFDGADLIDLANYNAFLHSLGAGYTLRTAVADRLKRIKTTADERADALRAQLADAQRELEATRAALRLSEANLSRAMGYIDRVTEGDPALTPTVERVEHVERRRGPNIDLGEPYRGSMSDFLSRR